MTGVADLTLVAHRGWPSEFPENTLLGFQQAAMRGATYVETDVQCTRDGVPVLYHDASTRRVSGVRGSLLERTVEEIGALSASAPGRFGDRFAGTPIPTLRAFAGWLAQHPALTAFIEIKQQSLKRFGVEQTTARVMHALEGLESRCIMISFDDRCIEHAAAGYAVRTGWVLPAWNKRTEARARALQPDFLFAEDVQLPRRAEDIWSGPWQWAVYVIDDLNTALSFVERGIRVVETDAIGDLLDQSRAGLS